MVVVTWNSARWLTRTLDRLADQRGVRLEVLVVDNASSDQSVELAERHPVVQRVIRRPNNGGYATGNNAGIASSSGPVVLCLNPDVFLEPSFVTTLVDRLEGRRAFATGKLLRADASTGEPTKVIDSTGLFFLRNRRHVDRGASEPDDGAYCEPEEVFGATGAALMATREALEDVAPPGHRGCASPWCGRAPPLHSLRASGRAFDEAFFSYREDADLAWRAQLLGWRCWYEPSALGYHVRALRPDDRRAHLDPAINMHSVKNRYLMLLKNESWASLRPDLVPVLARELLIAGGVLLKERSSLRAYPLLLGHLRDAIRQRRWIQARRVTTPVELRSRLFIP